MLSIRTAAILVGAGIDMAVNYHIRNKNMKLQEANAALAQVVVLHTEMIRYLSDVLVRHGIELNEFDNIVINDLAERLEEI